jgi:hypothetical protein
MIKSYFLANKFKDGGLLPAVPESREDPWSRVGPVEDLRLPRARDHPKSPDLYIRTCTVFENLVALAIVKLFLKSCVVPTHGLINWTDTKAFVGFS